MTLDLDQPVAKVMDVVRNAVDDLPDGPLSYATSIVSICDLCGELVEFSVLHEGDHCQTDYRNHRNQQRSDRYTHRRTVARSGA